MLRYNFLILSLIFSVPGILIYLFRKDLRKTIRILAVCSVPFGFTEFLFYPSYWEPVFLFNLVNYIGFGIEDLIFVIGLSAFTSTAYPFFFNKKLVEIKLKRQISSATILFGILFCCFFFVFLFAVSEFPIIYGAPILMILISLGIMAIRNDLILPGLFGGVLSMIIYAFLCLILLRIYPDLFQLIWHTEKFINRNIYGIPVEELIYGFASGSIATLFYPFVFRHGYEKII
ncbi:lycopene cyclase domain-containing protein [Leptospira ilyithenensis]|uniref:Lycopene cyclase domain-containing protein n=1 Tax=Leptospira ilyithenensis TaxID=2484901 RepID=A0A4R9LS01_9LEPT|nr:lycopene cyclase domain-containing protein [Leptospira ilyithenensis]TGN14043.1 hypothetical protein EHS11_02970 [Leptospira ilyithenensis]